MKNDKSKLIQWVLTFFVSTCIAAEKRLQRRLTQIPNVYHQDTRQNNELVSLLSAVLLRKLRPSLFIGTRSILNTISTFTPRPYSNQRFRELINVSYDGATIALDWEVPNEESDNSGSGSEDGVKDSQKRILNGKIKTPVVVILHGVNTDTSSGYMRAIMHSCTRKGYIACGMNSRGCGGVDLTTPRLHNAAYTNDLRDVVNRICSRLDENVPLLLVGYSLGANTMVKYLGECGQSNTLPKNLIGAASLGNPFKIDHSKMERPWSHILALGAKKSLLRHRNRLQHNPHYEKNMGQALRSQSLEEMTALSVGHVIRNDSNFPFNSHIGYDSAKDYMEDASSYRYIAHVPVPLIVAFASDDDIASKNTMQYMNYGLSNSNVVFVNTASGGHLGWHHAMRNNPFGSWKFYSGREENKGWGNRLVVKWIDAIVTKHFHRQFAKTKRDDRDILKAAALLRKKGIKSRL